METMASRPFARHTLQFEKRKKKDETTSTETSATTTSELTPAAIEPLHIDGAVSVHSVVVSLPKEDERNLLAIGCVLVKTASAPSS